MTITDKIYEALQAYKNLYDEEPELLFVNLQIYEEILKEPQLNAELQPVKKDFTIFGCKLIPVERMQSDFKYLSQADVAKAIKEFSISPTDLILIRKLEKTNRKEAANARRLGDEMMYKHFYIPYELIQAYQRYYENKDLEF
ncbi:hypothetical protein [Acinetobacter baumannii]|uniref:hypothetical protein n=1 Tax=Acinetobacter baumannii TaxID=470 RepID=UPI002542F610|nr:hypothetical protein [Acinetobacter baumannii]WIH75507.1 hypothetical protein M2A29_05650 [Acinetobacter baumannii]